MICLGFQLGSPLGVLLPHFEISQAIPLLLNLLSLVNLRLNLSYALYLLLFGLYFFSFLFGLLLLLARDSALLNSLDHVEAVGLGVAHLQVVKFLALLLVLVPIDFALIFVSLLFFVTHLSPILLHNFHDLLGVELWIVFLDRPASVLAVENEWR